MTNEDLQRENEQLRRQLAEAEETLAAIREGSVDAIVMEGAGGPQVFSLSGVETVYRVALETMAEAAIFTTPDGTILFCNSRFTDFVATPMEQVLGRELTEFVPEEDRDTMRALLDECARGPVERRIVFQGPGGARTPATLTGSPQTQNGSVTLSFVAADLTLPERQLARVERMNRLYAVLSRVNEAILRIRDQQELFEAACKIAVEAGGLVLAWIGFLDATSGRVRVAAKYGRDEGYLDTIDVSLDPDLPEGQGPTAVSLRECRSFINNDTANNPYMAPWRDAQLARGFMASASFPLVVSGSCAGVITLYAGEPDYFDDEEVRLLTALADDFSFALEAAEVAEQREQAVSELSRSRDELEERVQERTAELRRLYEERQRQVVYAETLNRINAAVHSSLEFDEIMGRIVVEVREALDVDTAAVQMHRDGYWEFAHAVGLTPELRDSKPRDEETPLSMIMLETREPVVVNDVDRDDRVNPEIMRRFHIKSLLGTPILLRDQVIAVLVVNRREPNPFTDAQVDFIRKAAATLGLALENARLYQAEHDIADRLQSALLALPDEVRGIEFAHAYHSATEAARVGGDFYDLFELNHDHVGVVIGDVADKGIDAAVLTSMVKNTIRAHASERGKTPKRIVALTNDVIYKATPTEAFVTVFFGILDCRDGRLVYANAGHTTAAVVGADGTVGRLNVTGPLLGAFEDVQFEEAEARLGVDKLLFLYTDGLTEARADGELYGEERVFTKLSTTCDGRPTDVVQELIADVLAFSHDRLRDDLAILAVRLLEQGAGTPHQQKLEM